MCRSDRARGSYPYAHYEARGRGRRGATGRGPKHALLNRKGVAPAFAGAA